MKIRGVCQFNSSLFVVRSACQPVSHLSPPVSQSIRRSVHPSVGSHSFRRSFSQDNRQPLNHPIQPFRSFIIFSHPGLHLVCSVSQFKCSPSVSQFIRRLGQSTRRSGGDTVRKTPSRSVRHSRSVDQRSNSGHSAIHPGTAGVPQYCTAVVCL